MMWQEILQYGHAQSSNPSMQRAITHKQLALDRMDFIRQHSITREHANFILQGYYDCIQDQVRALAALEGFTITTSIACSHFLKEILNEDNIASRLIILSETHDGIRILGKQIQYEKTSENIELALRIIEDLHVVVKQKIDEFTNKQIASGKLTL